jgi:hypothetical protein
LSEKDEGGDLAMSHHTLGGGGVLEAPELLEKDPMLMNTDPGADVKLLHENSIESETIKTTKS